MVNRCPSEIRSSSIAIDGLLEPRQPSVIGWGSDATSPIIGSDDGTLS